MYMYTRMCMYVYMHISIYVHMYIFIQGLTPFRRPLFRLLKASWGPHEWLLELSGRGLWGSRGRLGASWGLLGDIGAVLGCHGAVLDRCWRRLGAPLELHGAILRPSWALLGAS